MYSMDYYWYVMTGATVHNYIGAGVAACAAAPVVTCNGRSPEQRIEWHVGDTQPITVTSALAGESAALDGTATLAIAESRAAAVADIILSAAMTDGVATFLPTTMTGAGIGWHWVRLTLDNGRKITLREGPWHWLPAI